MTELAAERAGESGFGGGQRLQAHPRYAEAVRRFASNMLAAGDADRLLDGLLKDAGRNSAALCAAYLHFSGGLTLPRLKSLIGRLSSASPGRARALLLYLGYLGYVELLRTPQAGGPALYRPTARFLTTWRTHLSAVLEAAAVIDPAIERLLARFDAPAVFETYARTLCEGFLEEAQTFDADVPYYRVFMHRLGGVQITHAMIASADEFPPSRPFAFSTAAAARRFRVSRTQVRRVLEAAEREGLLHLQHEGAIAWTDAGREALDYFLSMQMSRFLIAAAHTRQALPDLLATAGPEVGAAV